MLKERFLIRQFQRDLRLYKRNNIPSLRKVDSVVVLTTASLYAKFDFVEQVTRTFETVKKVSVLIFGKAPQEIDAYAHYFSEKDFSWNGRIKSSDLTSFLDTSYDVLIGYYPTKQLYLEYVTLALKSCFKIGFSEINNHLFDLMINESPQKVKEYMKTINTYVGILQSKSQK